MKLIAFILLIFCPLSYAASIEALTEQAQSQNVDAQLQLGQKYLSGDGVEASRDEAIYWLEQAADSGSQQAAIDLANVYLANQSHQPDVTKAIYWLTRLALSDNYQAQFNLGKVYEGLSQAPSNLALAEVWYQVAAPNVPEAEDAYAKVLEMQFNAQRAKQVSSIDQLEVAFDDSGIELSPVAQSKYESTANNDFIYLSIALSIALIALLFWHLKATRSLNKSSQHSLSENKQEQRQLQNKIKQHEATIKTQKRQLETLYRQFKKQQATQQRPQPSQPTKTASENKLSLACALFGYKPDTIPDTKQIKTRYKQLCKIYHPDLKGSEEDMKRLNAALKIILSCVNK